MVNTIGLDIGGANTKEAFLSTRNGKIEALKVEVEYFPIWKNKDALADVLLQLKQKLGISRLDGVAVTMTAELSDAYQTKREGVNHILNCVAKAFEGTPILVLNVDSQLQSAAESKNKPLTVASANWAATGWLVAQHIKDCVVVDVGSTSTSIIPIVNGQVYVEGKNDLAKLLCGELVYTGSLRTNVAAIVNSIPIRNGSAGVSSELFALSGDVHLVLNNISENDYACETADGRGKTKAEALARLARVICADTEMLTPQEMVMLAQYIYDKQISQVAQGLNKVYTRIKANSPQKVPVVVTGLGKDFLAKKAARKIGADEIVDLADVLGKSAVLASPAVSVALMLASKLEGELVEWF